MCMHAHTRENEEKVRDKQKLAEDQASISSAQKAQLKLRITPRCQLL